MLSKEAYRQTAQESRDTHTGIQKLFIVKNAGGLWLLPAMPLLAMLPVLTLCSHETPADREESLRVQQAHANIRTCAHRNMSASFQLAQRHAPDASGSHFKALQNALPNITDARIRCWWISFEGASNCLKMLSGFYPTPVGPMCLTHWICIQSHMRAKHADSLHTRLLTRASCYKSLLPIPSNSIPRGLQPPHLLQFYPHRSQSPHLSASAAHQAARRSPRASIASNCPPAVSLSLTPAVQSCSGQTKDLLQPARPSTQAAPAGPRRSSAREGKLRGCFPLSCRMLSWRVRLLQGRRLFGCWPHGEERTAPRG